MTLLMNMLLVGQAHPGEPDTITMSEARTLSTANLARRVLGVGGAAYAEAQLVDGRYVGHPGELDAIWLAKKPRRSGQWGICEAELLWVTFDRAGTADRPDHVPVKVRDIWGRSEFAVVGPLTSPPMISSLQLKEQDALCAAATPVFSSGDVEATRYFGGTAHDRNDLNALEAWTALRAFELAQRWTGTVDCEEQKDAFPGWLCKDPQLGFRGKPLNSVGSPHIGRCEHDPAGECVRFGFSSVLPDRGWQEHLINVVVRLDAPRTSRRQDYAPLKISSVRVFGLTAVAQH